jgi:hypothetical protein
MVMYGDDQKWRDLEAKGIRANEVTQRMLLQKDSCVALHLQLVQLMSYSARISNVILIWLLK